MKPAAWLLFTVSPFAILEPLAYLSQTKEYARTFDWAYLGLAVTIALLSHQRQRKSFYYAGLVNTGVALWLITTNYDWFGKQSWAILLVAIGVAGLLAGLGLDRRERRQTVTVTVSGTMARWLARRYERHHRPFSRQQSGTPHAGDEAGLSCSCSSWRPRCRTS